MKGVGPGTVLGGRYTVHRRLAQDRGTERWTADDTTLGRRVSVLVVPTDDHRAPAFLDAARRAGSVAHAVLVRILDVGEDDEVAYVVEEELADARTLADLVTDGGIPGDEVRRITGEVASALESARQRGLHHLDLTPDDVLRTPDGEVRLRGLEIAAVRAGEDGLEPEESARRDAVGVVALTYAGLTGLWPLGSGAAGLARAPRVPGGVATPSEIAAGVPRDLDAICRLTLREDEGPTSPGDYARQVAPWPSRQVVGRPVVPAAAPAEEPEPTPEEPTPDEPAGEASEPSPAAPAAAATVAGTAALPALPVLPDPPAPAGGDDDEPTRVIERPTPPEWLHSETGELPGTPAADEAAPATPGPVTPAAATVAAPAVPRRPEAEEQVADDDDVEDLDDDREGRGAVASAAVAGAIGTVGSRVSGLARRAVDKVSELSPDTQAVERHDGLDDLDAPAPFVPAEPLTRDESKLALGIVVAFLVLALVIGIYGVTKIGSNSDLLGDTTAAPSTSSSATPTPTGSASENPDEGGTPEPLAILKVEAYDPEGDGAENNSTTPKTYDGDTSTGWSSENYRTDAFGGLKKGLGLVVDLGPNKKPQNVRLVIPQRVDLEVYVGPDAGLEGAKKIGTKADAQGTVDLPVPADVTGQYIIIWYTGLHPDDQGKRRAWLDEVVVTG
ncbi:protein kinase family protein [Phycicoccus avicenniae]|uniref:protein kinase family protein n=1 Tax=Phycicoccus avicenniae TaxID=2828860 RepID=UPI003D2BEF1D